MPPRKRGRVRQARPRGSVYWHAASARWCAQTPPDRHGRRRSRYFASEETAWAWLDQQLDALDDGRDIFAGAELLGDYLDQWLVAASGDPERQWTERTKTNYRWAIQKLEPLHGTRLEDLRRANVDSMIAGLSDQGFATASIRVIRSLLHSALEDLVDDEVLRTNPARRRRRRQRGADADVAITEIPWTEKDARRFLEAARSSPRAALWWLVTSCGLRNGELRALQLDDLDLQRGQLIVKRTATESGHRTSRTKGKRSRSIDLPQNVIAALRAHLSARRSIGGRLFQRDGGGPLRGDDLRRELQQLRRAAKVPPIARVHELRHIAASLMLANGYQIALVSQILGHKSIVTTLTIYTHIVPRRPIGRPRNIADVLPYTPGRQTSRSTQKSHSAVPSAVRLPRLPEAALALDLIDC